MNHVDVNATIDPPPQWSARVPQYCSAVMRALGIEGWEVSVLFCEDETIRELNRRHRGLDEATDVLSFSQLEGHETPVGAPLVPAGDIVISLAATRRNCEEDGVPFEREIERLLVHGILHLHGMDHPDGDDEMIRLQERLLDSVEVRLF